MDASPEASPTSPLAQAAAEWAGTRRVRVGPWQIRYREAGRGPAVVLTHGLGVSSDYWYRNGPEIAAAGYRVLAPDLPGFGHTPGPRGGLSISRQAGALLRWSSAVGVHRAVYVGHSLAGQTVLALAAYRPERVRALVLAAPTGEPRRFPLLHQALALLRDIPRESPRLAVEVARAYILAGPGRIWRTWRKGSRQDVRPLISRVQAPSLIIVGTRDPVVRPGFADSLAQALPGGRVVWIPGAAHAVIFDTAPQFNRAVLAFLRELEPEA